MEHKYKGISQPSIPYYQKARPVITSTGECLKTRTKI